MNDRLRDWLVAHGVEGTELERMAAELREAATAPAPVAVASAPAAVLEAPAVGEIAPPLAHFSGASAADSGGPQRTDPPPIAIKLVGAIDATGQVKVNARDPRQAGVAASIQQVLDYVSGQPLNGTAAALAQVLVKVNLLEEENRGLRALCEQAGLGITGAR